MQIRIKSGSGDLKHFPNWMDYRFLTLISYSVIVLTVMIFHEPWFDEAQAWLIARDTTLKELIFVRPHYESHPVFWHLLLRIPVKLGLPYEASIKAINFLFAFFAVYLVVYRSPFQTHFKVILPFTYFFLYQYGVISRPYAMLGCGMFLTAIAWKKRANQPWHLSLTLMFLCAASAYGIAIAGGFGVFWLLEKLTDKCLFKEKRTLAAMSALAVFAGILIINILPASDAVGLDLTSKGYSYISNLLLCFFMVPAEATVTGFSEYAYLTNQEFTPSEIIACTLISLLIWYLLFSFLRKRRIIGLFLLIYLFFSVIAARYMCVHHYGIVLYLIFTALWIGLDIHPCQDNFSFTGFISSTKNIRARELFEIRIETILTKKRILLLVMTSWFTLVNIYWSISSVKTDVQYNYGYGRMLAEYLTDHHLTSKSALAEWTIKKSDDHKIEYMDTNYICVPVVEANAYFNESLVENREQGLTYEEHRRASDEENETNLERLKALGTSEVVFSDLFSMLEIADILELDRDFHSEYVGETHKAWKNRDIADYLYIWVHN